MYDARTRTRSWVLRIGRRFRNSSVGERVASVKNKKIRRRDRRDAPSGSRCRGRDPTLPNYHVLARFYHRPSRQPKKPCRVAGEQREASIHAVRRTTGWSERETTVIVGARGGQTENRRRRRRRRRTEQKRNAGAEGRGRERRIVGGERENTRRKEKGGTRRDEA